MVYIQLIAIGFVLAANILAYAANENSHLHRYFRLPKFLHISNRAHATGKEKRPKLFWALDLVDPSHLVSSYWLSTAGLLALRIGLVFYFVLTIALEGLKPNIGFGRPAWIWWLWFTDWVFILFGISGLLGVFLTVSHYRQERRLRKQWQTSAVLADPGLAPSPKDRLPKWSRLEALYLLLAQTTAVGSLFVSVFYWAFLAGNGDRSPDCIMKHGTNNLVLLAEVFCSRLPFVSYHWQVMLVLGSVYLVFMWTYAGLSAHWVYEVLNWNQPAAVVLYICLPIFLFFPWLFWSSVVALREYLGSRLGGQSSVGEVSDRYVPESLALVQDPNLEAESMELRTAEMGGVPQPL